MLSGREEIEYRQEIEALFQRFPSVQTSTFSDAYKPGLQRMIAFDALLGEPHKSFKSVHVAGTNGKGSVANMLASSLAAAGYRTALYTSPHILDFRERMRIKDGDSPVALIPREYVLDFIRRYRRDFERLELSFFEITTGMAFKWFADSGAQWAVVEVGLGGRLDSTNIISPELSIITRIGLDHCALLGNTLEEIASEKAGIIKPGVAAVIGRHVAETAPVFTGKAHAAGAPLFFADEAEPPLMEKAEDLLRRMDLQGRCQSENLRTVLCSLQILGIEPQSEAIIHTASRMDFHGRWECLCKEPLVLCDIGHNAQALSGNFAQLEELLGNGYSSLIIVYAVMADKDFAEILPLMPRRAKYIFTTPKTRRALPAAEIARRFSEYFAGRGESAPENLVTDDVADAVKKALDIAEASLNPVVYIGGSTFAVSEAMPLFDKKLFAD